MARRSGRRNTLPAADVATVCLHMHHDLLRARSSLDLPETIERMMTTLARASRLEAIAVSVHAGGRSSILGGWQVPPDLISERCPPPVIHGLDGHERVCQATADTAIDSESHLHLAAYGRRRSPQAAHARQWLAVALPLVVLAVREAQQALSLTQSSVALEAEVERRTHEVLRLSASERELLAQLRAQTAQLQIANAELRQLDETKTGIISSVSHELRTPISTIKTLAQLLGRPDLPAHKHAQYIEVINAECDRQMGLVHDLLELARLEAGTAEPKRSWQDLGETISRVALRLREPIEAAGQGLTLPPTPGPDARVWAHQNELEQIVGNLLSNAHKFTDSGGRITVTVDPQPAGITLCVADTGIGIPPDQIERIFDTFYRVPHPERTPPGTGVGLAIVRRLVDNLGGTIQVDSQEGQGSRFSVTWPRS